MTTINPAGIRGESFADVARRVGDIAGTPVASDATDEEVLDALATSQSAAIADDVSAVTAGAAAATIAAADAVAAQRSVAIAARQSGNLPIGWADLSDKPVAEAECAYWNVRPYVDGVKVWPMRKVEAGFRPEWQVGSIAKRDLATGDQYLSVGIARTNDPTLDPDATVIPYYVDYDNPSAADTTAGGQGLSEELPWKRTNYGITQALALTSAPDIPHLIILNEEFIGSNSFPATNYTFTMTMKIEFRAPSGARSKLLMQLRESVSQATLAATDNGDGSFTYPANASVSDTIKIAYAHLDLLITDVDEVPLPMLIAADQATAQATPNSFQNTVVGGTVNDVMTLHRIDRAEPDPGINWAYAEAAGSQMTWLIDEDVTLYIGGKVMMFANIGSGAQPILHVRPTTAVAASWVAHTCRFFAEDIMVVGGNSEGVQIHDMEAAWIDRLVGKHCRKDIYNGHTFHTFAASGNANEGNYMHLGATDIVACEVGENYFSPQPALTLSNQGWSLHDHINGLFFNCYAENTYGAVGAHVGGAQVAEFNSSFNYPQNPVQVLPLGAGESPRCGMWADSTGVTGPDTMIELIFPQVKVDGGGFAYTATGDATIKVWDPRGDTTTETGTGGAVLDGYTDNPL